MGDDVEAAGFDYGDAVASCCRNGGNARYISLHHKDLTIAPGNVDSAQAAAVISTYMTAYQALHRCKPRGSKETLEGVNILVTGGNGPVGKAVIELAHRAGASKIFATAARKYHDELNEKGVCPLPLDSRMWLPLVKGKMDIVIDGICQDGYASPRAALNAKGHLVIVGMTLLMNAAEPGIFGSAFDTSVAHFKAGWLMSNTTRYCPYDSSRRRPDEWRVSTNVLSTDF
jgi:NADPH:quinone reductase-like Zn-dependent oxidoreductase